MRNSNLGAFVFSRLQTKHRVFLPFHINTMPSLFDNLNYLINLQIFNTYVTEYLQNRIQPHSQDHFLGWGQLKKPKDKSLGTRLPRMRTHGFYLMYYLTRTQQRTENQTRGGKTCKKSSRKNIFLQISRYLYSESRPNNSQETF